MPAEIPLEPRFVVWRCDHCRNGIEFDIVQLAGRTTCRVPCPHCGKETNLQEPPPPPRLILDEGWTMPAASEAAAAPEIKQPTATKQETAPTPAPAPVTQPVKETPAATPPSPAKTIIVNLPPDPPRPSPQGAVDVRWLTDLGVVYFRQHQFGEAYLCFSRAAEQGFATAQFCLAVCYINGHGTKQDEAAAMPWLLSAAKKGDSNAEFTLGLAYRFGRGVAPDEALAMQYLKLAAQHGHREAIQQVGGIEPQRSVEDKPAAKPEPPVVPVDSKPEKETTRRRHDLQRLILGLFRKK